MTSRAAHALLAFWLAASAGGPVSLVGQDPDRSAPWDPDWRAPTTAWGHPDLQGNWTNGTLTPFERSSDAPLVLTWEQVEQLEQGARDDCPANPGTVMCGRPASGGTTNEAILSGREYNEVYWDRGQTVAIVDGEPRSSLITFPPDGRIPNLTTEAQGRQREEAELRARFGQYDHPELRPWAERCVIYLGRSGRPSVLGPPMAPTGGYNHNYTIVQTADHVLVMSEMVHDSRVIRLGEHQPLREDVRLWFGDSWGRWEGRTLVVETTNVDQRQFGYHSRELKVIERFTRVSEDAILYEFEVHDPRTYAEPWGGEIPMKRFDDLLYEYACHEGNYSLEGVLRGGRYEEEAR